MSKFIFTEMDLQGCFLIEPVVYEDTRGFFMETYNYKIFREAGIRWPFVQDNQSRSKKGVLRGLHFQKNHPQGKLIRVINGEIWDVAVDLRPESLTYKKWVGVTLSAANKRQLYIPPGFAHGFLVMSDEADVTYKCTDFYHLDDEGGIRWDDPEINIEWPLQGMPGPFISPKDESW